MSCCTSQATIFTAAHLKPVYQCPNRSLYLRFILNTQMVHFGSHIWVIWKSPKYGCGWKVPQKVDRFFSWTEFMPERDFFTAQIGHQGDSKTGLIIPLGLFFGHEKIENFWTDRKKHPVSISWHFLKFHQKSWHWRIKYTLFRDISW